MSSQAHDDAQVDPPNFQLPDDFDPDRFELWTVRLPHQLDLSTLQKSRIEINKNNETQLLTQSNGNYSVQWGDPVENESFRLLLPADDDSDSDNDSDDSSNNSNHNKFLHPCRYRFARHVQIGSILQDDDNDDVESAANHDNPQRRRAYASVPQIQGLKRRWMPLGSGSVSLPSRSAAASRKRKHKQTVKGKELIDGSGAEDDDGSRARHAQKPETGKLTTISDGTVETNTGQQSERERKKARKAARKAAKKEKKKRKRKKDK